MKQIAPQVTWVSLLASNAYLIGERGETWAVVDTGMPGNFDKLRDTAATLFGKDARPEGVILTHGHIDHYGSALALSAYWDVPIFAPSLDAPYLEGRDQMPPLDPTVGGFFAMISRFLPGSGTDLGDHLRTLPKDGTVPGMPGWEWHATPGHTPGHVSLFREQDRVLIAGDAVLTVNLDDTAKALTMQQEFSRAPSPGTYDWVAARKSVEFLATLKPYTVAAGHGVPNGPAS